VNKLAIVGSHPATRANAPFDNPQYDIWVFNEAAQAEWCKRWTACFQMHRPEVYTSPHNMSNHAHWDWLQQDHGPDKAIWMQEVDPAVPNAQRYPLETIELLVPGAVLTYGAGQRRRWFDMSAAYALALAIHLGYEYVEIYGLDLISNTEYHYQLGNWRYWVGVAIGTGMTVVLCCEENDFGTGRLYGYDGEVQIERAHFTARVDKLERAWTAADKQLHRIKERMNAAILDHKYAKVATLAQECQAAAIAAGEISGALAEAQNYAKRDDPISRQEFEKRAAQAAKDGEELKAAMWAAAGKAEYVFTAWMRTGHHEALSQMRRFFGEQMEHAFNCGGRKGILQENQQYMTEVDARITAAGGQKTLNAMGVQ
jgi:hypothetical protein